jgi:hypothetical protein
VPFYSGAVSIEADCSVTATPGAVGRFFDGQRLLVLLEPGTETGGLPWPSAVSQAALVVEGDELVHPSGRASPDLTLTVARRLLGAPLPAASEPDTGGGVTAWWIAGGAVALAVAIIAAGVMRGVAARRA